MTRPALTWALLWLGIASAVAAGIVVAALLLSAIDVRASSSTGPDAALFPRRAHVADDAGGVSVHPSPPATLPGSAGSLSGQSTPGAPSNIAQSWSSNSPAPAFIWQVAGMYLTIPHPSPATHRPAPPMVARAHATTPSAAPVLVAVPVRSASEETRATTATGLASWFRSPIGVSAAGPALRAALGPGWRGSRVHITGPAGAITVVLGDWMRRNRLIDLDDDAFVAVCGPLSLGLCEVEVSGP